MLNVWSQFQQNRSSGSVLVPLPTLATLANWRGFFFKLNELQLSFVPILFSLTRMIASSWGQRHRCTQCSWLVWKAGFWVSQTLRLPHQWWDHGHQPVKVQDQLEVCGPSEALHAKMRSFSHTMPKWHWLEGASHPRTQSTTWQLPGEHPGHPSNRPHWSSSPLSQIISTLPEAVHLWKKQTTEVD